MFTRVLARLLAMGVVIPGLTTVLAAPVTPAGTVTVTVREIPFDGGAPVIRFQSTPKPLNTDLTHEPLFQPANWLDAFTVGTANAFWTDIGHNPVINTYGDTRLILSATAKEIDPGNTLVGNTVHFVLKGVALPQGGVVNPDTKGTVSLLSDPRNRLQVEYAVSAWDREGVPQGVNPFIVTAPNPNIQPPRNQWLVHYMRNDLAGGFYFLPNSDAIQGIEFVRGVMGDKVNLMDGLHSQSFTPTGETIFAMGAFLSEGLTWTNTATGPGSSAFYTNSVLNGEPPQFSPTGFVHEFGIGFGVVGATIPEPATLALLAMGGTLLLRHRRKSMA